MEIGDQLHAPTACGEEKNLCHRRDLKSDSPVIEPVA
jgi:hypothetical protein